MSRLFALIVGTNYDSYPARKLDFAIEDAEKVHSFLKRKTQNPEILTLMGPQATKTNIVNAFKTFFKPAKSNDVCLFYFVGHGTQVAPPPELKNLLTPQDGNFFQAIMCDDSRSGNENELVDKELSYLIWQVYKDKYLQNGIGHFLVIMDCCHAGDNSKTSQTGLKTRAVPRNFKGFPFKEYVDYLNLISDYPDKNTVTHIHLAACARDEDAGESVFTPILLDVIENSKVCSYQESISKVREKMARSRNQNPQIYPSGNNVISQKDFLGGLCFK